MANARSGYNLMEASMKMQTVASLPPSRAAYLKRVVKNGYPVPEQAIHFAPQELIEPPTKRLCTSEISTSASIPDPPYQLHNPNNHNLAHDVQNAMQNTSMDGSFGDSHPSGASNTPIASTIATSITSCDPFLSNSPPITPTQTKSSPSFPYGVQALDSNMIDRSKCRPRSSIPSNMKPETYGRQCIASAYASRLNPFALHPKEQAALENDLCHNHVTLYLNIRNGILRLWTRNPMVSVSRDEALGCAKEYRWMNLASFAYEWLVLHGYINHGCVEVPLPFVTRRRGRRREGPVIVVIGGDADTNPHVIVLEGRRRIGGRIYSHPLYSLDSEDLPEGLVPKAEMGAQIIVGFDRGNPLDQVIRSQLGLHYHLLRDLSTIYDSDGTPVHEVQDAMDQKLYNDVLDRSGFYRHKALVKPAAEGDRDMIEDGRESTTDTGISIKVYEDARAAGTTHLLVPTKRVRRRRGVGHKTTENRPIIVDAGDDVGHSKEQPAALTCQNTGWELNPGVSEEDTIELDGIASARPRQTLGRVMDEGVKQYQHMLPLTPKDMRLLNWHFANLEYANATNINNLSLSGWDQDIGNEFEGEHSQVIGGYSQLPFGLYTLPYKLDVRTNKVVQSISYDPSETDHRKASIHCEDGEQFLADHVVYTGSLGTLKRRTIQFNPPLPDWKLGAIDRLGFGVMNKVVLVFEEPFWDTERDMFGLLREPDDRSSMIQEDYAKNRGRFYLFWNCMKTTGLPVLIALMAGDAAHQAEQTPDHEILCEVISQLRNVFKHTRVPDPLETIITRWASDKFTFGSYSYVAADALPADYDLMARNIGNLHFAGEATCGTHPATVHGAYLSGQRAAAEIIESLFGPIELPKPLIPEKSVSTTATPTEGRKNDRSPKPSTETTTQPSSTPSHQPSNDKAKKAAYEQAYWAVIYERLGPQPIRPAKAGLNPFLMYQKDYWTKCREQCDEALQATKPGAKAARDEVRHALGQMWRNASAEEKQPYLDQVEANRRLNETQLEEWRVAAENWDRLSFVVRDQWCEENPYEQWEVPGPQ
ncbi:hypothetical protein N7468_010185 [Penicillium chermesinum]|uniref:Uncharacterized protein n=1 Tax=Penicillium chermesinum TaxID=63820 RepID=A0A9W9NC74_9EURO|nr:uncharacterized protein N7468_010185 [Penicillium chermesinum]KAJ5217177.1 hypothetical protein N7468_010185 [Penicillium chermesinum]